MKSWTYQGKILPNGEVFSIDIKGNTGPARSFALANIGSVARFV